MYGVVDYGYGGYGRVVIRITTEAINDVFQQDTHNIIYDTFSQVLHQTINDIHLMSYWVDKLYGVQGFGTGPYDGKAGYDIFQQKLPEARSDTLIQTIKEGIYPIDVLQSIEAIYDLLTKSVKEGIYPIDVLQSIEAIYDLLTKSVKEGIYPIDVLQSIKDINDIHMMSYWVDKLYGVQGFGTGPYDGKAGYDIFQQKLPEARSDTLIQTIKEGIYPIDVLQSIEAIYSCLIQINFTALDDIHINYLIESIDDLQAKLESVGLYAISSEFFAIKTILVKLRQPHNIKIKQF